MKNFKKLFAVLIVVTMLVAMYVPAAVSSFQTYGPEAIKLNGLGLYNGISTTTFDPGSDMLVTKEQAVTLIVRAFGGNRYALALNERDIQRQLVNYVDSDQISAWARPYFAAGLGLGLINGDSSFKLNPQAPMDAKMMAKLILVNAEYAVDVTTYQTAVWRLRDLGAYTTEQALIFDSKTQLTRDDLAGMMFYGLQTIFRTQPTLTIIGWLVNNSFTTEYYAMTTGIYTRQFKFKMDKAINDFETLPVTTATEWAAVVAIRTAFWPDVGTPGSARGYIRNVVENVYIPGIDVAPLKTYVDGITARFDARWAYLTGNNVGANLLSISATKTTVVLNFDRAINTATLAANTTIVADLNGMYRTIPMTTLVWSNDNKTVTVYDVPATPTATPATPSPTPTNYSPTPTPMSVTPSPTPVTTDGSTPTPYWTTPSPTPAWVSPTPTPAHPTATPVPVPGNAIEAYGTRFTVSVTTGVKSFLGGPCTAATMMAYAQETLLNNTFELAVDDPWFAQLRFNKPLDPTTVAAGIQITAYGETYLLSEIDSDLWWLSNNNQIVNVNIWLARFSIDETLVGTWSATAVTVPTLKLAGGAFVANVPITKTTPIVDISAPIFDKKIVWTDALNFTLYPSEILFSRDSYDFGWIYWDGTYGLGYTPVVEIDGYPVWAYGYQDYDNHTWNFSLEYPLDDGAHTMTIENYYDWQNRTEGPTVTFTFYTDFNAYM